MESIPLAPTIEEVERITKLSDPVIRNLQITQCYHELSAVLAARGGLAANWCTFATWASRQAGQSIRKEDLARLLDRLLAQSTSHALAAEKVAAAVQLQAGNQAMSAPDLALRSSRFTPALERVSDAVGRGNQKVFEEIGYQFARFYALCFSGPQLEPQMVARFRAELRPGQPPGGQDYLSQAFLHYVQALGETGDKARAELLLLANVEIGFHEQTRLQPEIAESLDAGFTSFLEFTRALFRQVFPWNGWFHLAHLYLRRLLGRPTDLDLAIRTLLGEIRLLLRQAITELMMTISLPSGVVLRLGEDLTAGFPESLKHITNLELNRFLEKYDLTPDSLSETGAIDWADLPDRLHFILDLFRCYQEHPNLLEPPFTPEQVEALKNGRLPDGKL